MKSEWFPDRQLIPMIKANEGVIVHVSPSSSDHRMNRMQLLRIDGFGKAMQPAVVYTEQVP